MNRPIILLIIIFNITFLIAENTDSLSYKWQWEGFHAINVTYSPSITSDIKDTVGSSSFSLLNTYLQLPIIRKKHYIGAGLTHRATFAQLYGTPFDSLHFSSNTSNALHLLLAYNLTINKSFHYYAEYNGGINGIWHDFGKSQSHMLATYLGYHYKKNIYFRGGGVIFYLFGKPTFAPLIGASIGISDHFAIDMLLPVHLLFRFRINNMFEVGSKITYDVGNAGFDVENSDLMVNYAFSDISGAIYSDFRIINGLIVRIQGGGYLMRNIKIIDINNNKKYLDISPKETPFLSLSLRWQV